MNELYKVTCPNFATPPRAFLGNQATVRHSSPPSILLRRHLIPAISISAVAFRPLGYSNLQLAAAAAAAAVAASSGSSSQTTPKFRRMLPTRTFTACKTRPFKQIHRGFLQTRTAPMTACVFVGDGPLLTRLPILRLLTFRLRLLLFVAPQTLGKCCKFGWRCHEA